MTSRNTQPTHKGTHIHKQTKQNKQTKTNKQTKHTHTHTHTKCDKKLTSSAPSSAQGTPHILPMSGNSIPQQPTLSLQSSFSYFIFFLFLFFFFLWLRKLRKNKTQNTCYLRVKASFCIHKPCVSFFLLVFDFFVCFFFS